jgi:uncharacterized membrane-anchored protein YitT (DUF2179 family)
MSQHDSNVFNTIIIILIIIVICTIGLAAWILPAKVMAGLATGLSFLSLVFWFIARMSR